MSTIALSFQDKYPIRIEEEAGEPWFNAADVCSGLGYSNGWDAIAKHVETDDLAKREVIDVLGRKQSASFVNESGLYALIFGSKLERAKEFKKWVTSEVLPSIRRTGSYQMALPLHGKHRGRKPIGNAPKNNTLTVRLSSKAKNDMNAIIASTGVSATRFIERAIDAAKKPPDDTKLINARRLEAKEKRLAAELVLRTLRSIQRSNPSPAEVYASAAADAISKFLADAVAA